MDDANKATLYVPLRFETWASVKIGGRNTSMDKRETSCGFMAVYRSMSDALEAYPKTTEDDVLTIQVDKGCLP